ncbi:keratin, type 1 cytoskeletal 11-like [Lampetra fluviatilis]
MAYYSSSSRSVSGGGGGGIVLGRSGAASVYGGSSCRVSSASFGRGSSAGCGGGAWGSSQFKMIVGGQSGASEKVEMQGLNERLAEYLDKVKFLESANQAIELKIKEMLQGKGSTAKDYSVYYSTIEDLREKVRDVLLCCLAHPVLIDNVCRHCWLSIIGETTHSNCKCCGFTLQHTSIFVQILENAKISLEIDNARLAADDFRSKWETEAALRMSVEADIGNLRGLLDEYGMACMGLEGDIEALREELIFMKKNHEDELAALRAQLSGANMSVEVDSTRGQDLHKILDDMRAQYEGIIAVNRANAEMAFNKQAEIAMVQGAQQSQAASAAQSEVSETRHAMQSLAAELESLRALIRSLEDQLYDTEDRKARELASYTVHIQMLEGELGSVQMGINQQLKDYAELLNMKMKLEQEISTYRRLLEGEDSRLRNISSESSHSMQSCFSFGTGSKGESSSSYQSSSTTGSGSGSGAASSSVSSATKSTGGASTAVTSSTTKNNSSYQSSSTTGSGSGSGAASSSISSATKSAGGSSTTGGASTAMTSSTTKTTSQTSSLSSDGAFGAASNSVVVDNDASSSSSSSTTITTSSTTKEVVIEPEPKREEVKTTKTVIITQTIVDGQVVESTEEVAEKTLPN